MYILSFCRQYVKAWQVGLCHARETQLLCFCNFVKFTLLEFPLLWVRYYAKMIYMYYPTPEFTTTL